MNASTTTSCATCAHFHRPLPTDWAKVDFFDRTVIAQEAVFRTTCTVVPDADKPCLKSAPVAVSATDDHKTIPHADAFGMGRKSHGIILDEFAVSRLSAAAQGIHAVLAVLQRRELDAELQLDPGLTFGPELAQGLLAAAATCAEFVQAGVEGDGHGVAHAFHGTPAYAHLEAARLKVMQASRTHAGGKKS